MEDEEESAVECGPETGTRVGGTEQREPPHMDIVPDSSSIWSVIIVSENGELGAPAHHHLPVATAGVASANVG